MGNTQTSFLLQSPQCFHDEDLDLQTSVLFNNIHLIQFLYSSSLYKNKFWL